MGFFGKLLGTAPPPAAPVESSTSSPVASTPRKEGFFSRLAGSADPPPAPPPPPPTPPFWAEWLLNAPHQDKEPAAAGRHWGTCARRLHAFAGLPISPEALAALVAETITAPEVKRLTIAPGGFVARSIQRLAEDVAVEADFFLIHPLAAGSTESIERWRDAEIAVWHKCAPHSLGAKNEADYLIRMRAFRDQVLDRIRMVVRAVLATLPDDLQGLADASAPFRVELRTFIPAERAREFVLELRRLTVQDWVCREKQLFRAHTRAFDQLCREEPWERFKMHLRDQRDPVSLLGHPAFSSMSFARFFTQPVPFAFPKEARFEHLHLLAGSGHGKTQCLQHLILADLDRTQNERLGLVVLDSQGDLINNLLSLAHFDPNVRGSLADRLVYVDPNDILHPVGLNLFDTDLTRFGSLSPVDREKLANATVEVYAYMFSSLLGAELTQKQSAVFNYLARAMLVIPGATILTLRELLEGGPGFREHFATLSGSARHFFENQFYTGTFRETRQQILTRLLGVLSNQIFERMFTHPKNSVDMFGAMQQGKIVLINTAKELLNTEGASILGRFFIALIAHATLARAALPERERTPCMLYIDEAQDYFDQKIGELMNQSRKYRLGVTLAHQNLDQLSLELRSTILASTSIKLAGGMNAKDAALLAREMRCETDFLQSMQKHHDHTDFACFVRHHMSGAIHLPVPFGTLEARPRLNEAAREALLAANRTALTGTHQAPARKTASRAQSGPDPGEPRTQAEPKGPRFDDDADFFVS